MRLLFVISDAEWTARARIFVAAAKGLSVRGHEISIACPPGPAADRLHGGSVAIVRLDPNAGSAIGTFDMRKVARAKAIDVAFVHSTRDQLIVGTGLRLSGGGAVLRRLPAFQTVAELPGMFTARMAPAGALVTTDDQAATLPTGRWIPPSIVPLGVDPRLHDQATPVPRDALRLQADMTVVGCPFAPDGRIRLANAFRALSLLAARHRRLRAVVFGSSSMHDDMRMHAAALGVAPLLTFVRDSDVDPVRIMKACDFVWVAADHDAAGLGCLDAMALRLPVIAERSRLTEHYVADGITGALLPGAEPSHVASAVADIITRRDIRTTFGNAGRARVQREFSEQAMLDGFERAAIAAVATTGQRRQ